MKTILVALLIPLTLSAQIVSNGDFETPDITPEPIRNLPTGAVFGWYVVFGNVDLIDTGGGEQVLDLNGFATGAVQQTLSTPTDKYDLTFTWTPNVPDAQISGTHVLAAVVNWNSQTLAALVYNVDNRVASHPSTIHLTIQGNGSDTLQFISRNGGTGGIMIDKVTLTAGATGDLSPPVTDPGFNPAPVPEPHAYAAFAGLGLCAFAAWRKCFSKERVV